MNVLKISNKGLLDINELILMGCSSKSGENTIGKFGTGLKYAIAVLVRNNIDFDIFIGKQRVPIQKEPVQIRDNTFQRVVIDYTKTSITTNLGVEWEVWMAVREFIANAKDEGGGFEITDSTYTDSESTTIIFNNLSQVEDCLTHFDFEGWEEVDNGLFFKRLDEPRRAKVFKEGFLVYEAEADSSFDYRIDDLEINESRMAEDRHDVKRGIAKIMSLMEKEDVETIISNDEVNHGTFYSHDTLSKGWEGIEKKDVSGGYELKKAVHRNEAIDKGHDSVRLLNRGDVFVSEDHPIKSIDVENVFHQRVKDDSTEIDWDIDLRTNKIYIWSGDKEVNAIKEAVKIRDSNIMCTEYNLKTPVDAILFLRGIVPGLLELVEKAKVPGTQGEGTTPEYEYSDVPF